MSTIEFSLVEVAVLHGLKQGNDVLKEIHKEMNLESVEKLLEETSEAQAYQLVLFLAQVASPLLTLSQEIDEMLANTLSNEEQDVVEAELLELQASVVSFITHPSRLSHCVILSSRSRAFLHSSTSLTPLPRILYLRPNVCFVPVNVPLVLNLASVREPEPQMENSRVAIPS